MCTWNGQITDADKRNPHITSKRHQRVFSSTEMPEATLLFIKPRRRGQCVWRFKLHKSATDFISRGSPILIMLGLNSFLSRIKRFDKKLRKTCAALPYWAPKYQKSKLTLRFVRWTCLRTFDYNVITLKGYLRVVTCRLKTSLFQSPLSQTHWWWLMAVPAFWKSFSLATSMIYSIQAQQWQISSLSDLNLATLLLQQGKNLRWRVFSLTAHNMALATTCDIRFAIVHLSTWNMRIRVQINKHCIVIYTDQMGKNCFKKGKVSAKINLQSLRVYFQSAFCQFGFIEF